MMHALVVEDITATSDLIKGRINSLTNDISQIDQAYNLDSAYQYIVNNNYDIIFLDIQMPNGTTFDLLKKLSEEKRIAFEIIFITGQTESEYLINAIKFSAIDFLYKPLEDEALSQAIHKAKDKIENRKNAKRVELLLEYVDTIDKTNTDRVAFQLSKGVIKFFNINDISYLKADGVVTKIHLIDGTEYSATKNLGYYRSFLINQFDFCSISHSLIINMEQVDDYLHKDLIVTMKNGLQLKASRRGGKEFKDKMEESMVDKRSYLQRLKNFLN